MENILLSNSSFAVSWIYNLLIKMLKFVARAPGLLQTSGEGDEWSELNIPLLLHCSLHLHEGGSRGQTVEVWPHYPHWTGTISHSHSHLLPWTNGQTFTKDLRQENWDACKQNLHSQAIWLAKILKIAHYWWSLQTCFSNAGEDNLFKLQTHVL